MEFDDFQGTTLPDLLATQSMRYPDRSFLRLGPSSWTYREVEEMARSLAGGLVHLGLKAGDRVAVLLPNVPEFVVTLFSLSIEGLIHVPINIRRHPKEVLSRLVKAGARAVVTCSDPETLNGVDHLAMVADLRTEAREIKWIISLSQSQGEIISWKDLLKHSALKASQPHSPEQPAAIVHTLGSSGVVRGAILTHGSLTRNAAQVAEGLACTSRDVFLGAVPYSNAFGLTPTILACATAGAELVCLPRYSPGEALRLINECSITVHHGVPTMFSMEINAPEFRPGSYPSLRTGIMSGAPCPPQLVKRVRTEMGLNLILAYGLTEASPSVTMTRLDDGPVTATETVGRPHEGVALKVISTKGETLPAGEIGELCVRGYNVMQGYWDDPIATRQVLDPDGWLHTGDLALIDPDGPVRIVGREYEVINRGGFKIYPGAVEMVLRSHPSVKDAAVVGVSDLIYGELSYACVVPFPETRLTQEDLIEFASAHLAEYALPDRVMFFEALPRKGSGPVRRDYLRERVRIRGHAWKFGKNIDTDAIIPARRCNTADPRELALYCMEDADPDFVQRMRRGDLIVAETNFGCGSSREVAPLSIKAAGVSAVIAKSFARIFFRNAINIGLPILECPAAVDGIQEGDEVLVEPATGSIHNLSRGESYQAEPFPDFLQRIIDRGGLLAYVEEKLAQDQAGDGS